MAGISDKIFELIKDTVESCGVSLWDVRFLKEGASHYLRVFIDKPDGVSINDCTDVSHAIDPLLDEADPIDCSYYLEVCSPGMECELTRDEHFEKMIGERVRLKLYRALDGSKELSGTLVGYNKGPIIETDNGNRIEFDKKEISKAVISAEF